MTEEKKQTKEDKEQKAAKESTKKPEKTKTGEKPQKEAPETPEEAEPEEPVIEESVEEEPEAEVVQAAKKYRKEDRAREKLEAWVPKTTLGKKVVSKEVTSIEQIYSQNLPILEPEIVDFLVPNLDEEILKIKIVQRTTDSGRKGSFFVVAGVGNKDGIVGVGRGRSKELRPAIDEAIRDAKRRVISIRRGCGSWECGCGKPHTLPAKVEGSYGSVSVTLKPAPRGTGLVVGAKASKVLDLAGIKDVWGKTSGTTSTTYNYAKAVMEALKHSRKMRLSDEQEKIMQVVQ